MRMQFALRLAAAVLVVLGIVGCSPMALTDVPVTMTLDPLATSVEPSITPTLMPEEEAALNRALAYLGEKVTQLELIEIANIGDEYRVRFQQIHQGIPVFSAIVSVFVPNNGAVWSNETLYPGIQVASTTPVISAEASIEASLASVGVQGSYSVVQQPKLVIYPAERAGQTVGVFVLAWQLQLRSICPDGQWFLVVESENGRVLEQANTIMTDGDISDECPTPALLPTVTLASPVPKVTITSAYPGPGVTDVPITSTQGAYPAPSSLPGATDIVPTTQTAVP